MKCFTFTWSTTAGPGLQAGDVQLGEGSCVRQPWGAWWWHLLVALPAPRGRGGPQLRVPPGWDVPGGVGRSTAALLGASCHSPLKGGSNLLWIWESWP